MRLAAPITRSADALASSSHHVHAWDQVSGDAFGPPLEVPAGGNAITDVAAVTHGR
jgi:hypothetical protein